jgi:hypothetical protein
MEKVRLTLWDIFTFFFVGTHIGVCVVIVTCLRMPHALLEALPQLVGGSSILTTVGAGAIAILAGMLVEPLANYFDRYVLNQLPGKLRVKRTGLNDDDKAARAFAVAHVLKPLQLDLNDPFQALKDYAERQQIAPTVMVFLSRFGFYRSVAFVTFTSSVVLCVSAPTLREGLIELFGGAMILFVLKARADEFYSYIAPAVYRAVCASFFKDAGESKPSDLTKQATDVD